jgi:hypothetical protein
VSPNGCSEVLWYHAELGLGCVKLPQLCIAILERPRVGIATNQIPFYIHIQAFSNLTSIAADLLYVSIEYMMLMANVT